MSKHNETYPAAGSTSRSRVRGLPQVEAATALSWWVYPSLQFTLSSNIFIWLGSCKQHLHLSIQKAQLWSMFKEMISPILSLTIFFPSKYTMPPTASHIRFHLQTTIYTTNTCHSGMRLSLIVWWDISRLLCVEHVSLLLTIKSQCSMILEDAHPKTDWQKLNSKRFSLCECSTICFMISMTYFTWLKFLAP